LIEHGAKNSYNVSNQNILDSINTLIWISQTRYDHQVKVLGLSSTLMGRSAPEIKETIKAITLI